MIGPDLCAPVVRSFPLTRARYHNLIPVPGMRPHLHTRRFPDGDSFAFIGTPVHHADAMRRCAFI